MMRFTAVFRPVPEGGYICWLEEMPGVQSQGETLDEARTNLRDAFELSVTYLRERSLQDAGPGALREEFEPSAA